MPPGVPTDRAVSLPESVPSASRTRASSPPSAARAAGGDLQQTERVGDAQGPRPGGGPATEQLRLATEGFGKQVPILDRRELVADGADTARKPGPQPGRGRRFPVAYREDREGIALHQAQVVLSVRPTGGVA
ncbi:MAG TPA: hypothetical protein VES19_08775 [Candidatus Limnocylindrales bacterium]|nr:hypothetical protein [Candidatus Limnocylindrales bacterium]